MTNYSKIITIIICSFAIVQNAQAEIIWGDHFDSDADFVCTELQGNPNLLGIEGGKVYEDCQCNHTSNTEIRIQEGFDKELAGKGLRYRFDTAGDTTETCQLRVNDTGNYEGMFWGFWLKIPNQPIGGSDASLKMSRFYNNSSSIIPGINFTTGEFYLSWQGASRIGWSSWPKIDLYALSDNDWHFFVQEFQSGGTGDGDEDFFDGSGVYRMWVDGNLEFETTTIDWGLNDEPFSWAGGYLSETIENLNGNYNSGIEDLYLDDIIWATTKQEADDFLGVIFSDITAPASPQGLSVF